MAVAYAFLVFPLAYSLSDFWQTIKVHARLASRDENTPFFCMFGPHVLAVSPYRLALIFLVHIFVLFLSRVVFAHSLVVVMLFFFFFAYSLSQVAVSGAHIEDFPCRSENCWDIGSHCGH